MNVSSSDYRKVKNEVFFRDRNEQIQKGFDELNKIADEEGDTSFDFDTEAPLYFYCECSDENCKKRIEISLDDYNAIHQNNKTFVIMPGHETNEIEHVIKKTHNYYVVEKYIDPPITSSKLLPTPVNNT